MNPFSPPAVWTGRVYPFQPTAVWTCRVFPFPPPPVWTYSTRCILSTTSYMGVQCVSPSTTSSMNMQCVSLSTISGIDVGRDISFPQHKQCEIAGYIPVHRLQFGCAGCMYPFSVFLICRNAGLFGMGSVQCQNETKCLCLNQSGIGIRGTSPVPECSCTGLIYQMPECQR